MKIPFNRKVFSVFSVFSLFLHERNENRANIFLKCFNGYFTDEEGRETARQLDIIDYGDFIGLLQETRAIQKTSLGKYRINRHFL